MSNGGSTHEYLESLEECGTNNFREIERNISSHIKRLEVEYGLIGPVTNKDIRSDSLYHNLGFSIFTTFFIDVVTWVYP